MSYPNHNPILRHNFKFLEAVVRIDLNGHLCIINTGEQFFQVKYYLKTWLKGGDREMTCQLLKPKCLKNKKKCINV
jgi:hypothetical protein